MAGGGGPVEFFVDVEELGRLRNELQTLEVELGDLVAQGAGADPGALGADVAGAVDRFAVFWTDGRARITENIGQCRVLAEGAAEGLHRRRDRDPERGTRGLGAAMNPADLADRPFPRAF
jgi:hypothetical protein